MDFKEDSDKDQIQEFDPVFDMVVEDILRGEYVLVLGSEVILDLNDNDKIIETKDSAKYFMECLVIVHAQSKCAFSND